MKSNKKMNKRELRRIIREETKKQLQENFELSVNGGEGRLKVDRSPPRAQRRHGYVVRLKGPGGPPIYLTKNETKELIAVLKDYT